jgi:hypothetical protein
MGIYQMRLLLQYFQKASHQSILIISKNIPGKPMAKRVEPIVNKNYQPEANSVRALLEGRDSLVL